MSMIWIVLLCVILIGIQLALLWGLRIRQGREVAAFLDIVTTLANSIQPPAVREHCRRVAGISGMLAAEMAFSSRRVARIRVAGLLHELAEIDDICRCSDMELEIVAVADYFDNAILGRSDPVVPNEAIEQIRRQAGKLFHPHVVKALMKVALEDETAHIGGPSVP